MSLPSFDVIKQLQQKRLEDKHMKVIDYINSLCNFYNEASKYPLSKLTVFVPDDRQSFVVDNKIEIRAHQFVSVVNYNLGFTVGRTCYLTGKLANKNARILEEYLSPDYDTCLISVKINKKTCELYAYDQYGNVLRSDKIKFTTVNWFTSVKENLCNTLNAN